MYLEELIDLLTKINETHLNSEQEKIEARKVAELEAQGYRVVDGGQTDGYGDDGTAPYEYTDWRTSEVLQSGRIASPADIPDPPGSDMWYHIDRVLDNDDLNEVYAHDDTKISDVLVQSLLEGIKYAAEPAIEAVIADKALERSITT
jgi:hypothetical protein